MGTNQSYLFLLLLASLSTSCTSDCLNTDPYLPSPFFVKRYHECAKLYIMLETALRANPENLYLLQDFFFPSSSSEPIYVLVTFTLNEHHHSTCWTSSVLLKSLDPSVLTFLQIQLLHLLFQLEDPSTGFDNAELFFNLTVNSTVSDYSHYINSTLQELTSWLKVYASTRLSHTADFQYKGYNCEPDVTITNLLISTLVLTVALTMIALIIAAPKLYRKITSRVERGNQWYSFFWAASFITSLCNIAVVSCEVMILGIVLQSVSHQFIVKIIMVSLLILLDFLVAICIIPKSAEFPISRLAYILFFPLCCTCCCCCCRRYRDSNQLHSKWIQSLALTSLLLFTQFNAMSALPTILRALLFPTQTLANITLFTAAIFCATALIALLLRNTGQLVCIGGCRRGNCYHGFMQPLPILMVALFLAIMVMSCYLYIKLIATGVESNQIGGFIVSFLPSAILTIIGWFVTKGKFIKQMFPQESNQTRNSSQVDPPTEQTPLNASLNV